MRKKPKNREASPDSPDKIPQSPVMRERNVAYNPAIGARMIKSYLQKHYPELLTVADQRLPEVFKDDTYFPSGINYFSTLKAEFKTATGKPWDENIDTYLAFANLKAMENISKILSQKK